MKATTPPRAWASARTCWQTVVLPDDSGPKISVIRPRGMPPTPSARSSAIDPVGIESTACRSAEPSFMIAPRPNCFSIADNAASTALPRSASARSAVRSSVIAIRSSRSSSIGSIGQRSGPRWPPSRRSAFFRVVLDDDWLLLARLPDHLDVLRGLRQRRQARLGQLGFLLLLGLFVGPISRAHRFASALSCSVPPDPSRGLLRDFAAAHPARARAQIRHVSGERSGPDRGADPGHEV